MSRLPEIGFLGLVVEALPDWLWRAILSWAGVTEQALEDLFNPLTDREEV